MFVRGDRSMNGNYESEAGSLTAPKVRPYPSPGRQAWVSVPHRIQGLKARHKMNAGKEIGRLDRISFSPLRYEIFVPGEDFISGFQPFLRTWPSYPGLGWDRAAPSALRFYGGTESIRSSCCVHFMSRIGTGDHHPKTLSLWRLYGAYGITLSRPIDRFTYLERLRSQSSVCLPGRARNSINPRFQR